MLTFASGVVPGLFAFLLIIWLRSKVVDYLSFVSIDWEIAVPLTVAVLAVIALLTAYCWR